MPLSRGAASSRHGSCCGCACIQASPVRSITSYFFSALQPALQACAELGIGLTMVKRLSRKYGIMRWPYRKNRAERRVAGWDEQHDVANSSDLGEYEKGAHGRGPHGWWVYNMPRLCTPVSGPARRATTPKLTGAGG